MLMHRNNKTFHIFPLLCSKSHVLVLNLPSNLESLTMHRFFIGFFMFYFVLDKIELKRKRLRTANEPFSHDNSPRKLLLILFLFTSCIYYFEWWWAQSI